MLNYWLFPPENFRAFSLQIKSSLFAFSPGLGHSFQLARIGNGATGFHVLGIPCHIATCIVNHCNNLLFIPLFFGYSLPSSDESGNVLHRCDS